ncbi:AraC-like DNA-binding protein [Flavobacterium sp. HSC-32F16]|uniref:helix-turn-helix domain-containing protein n=1 Tax=Flavobacterium sp. HSC-32F16 TaxID=2910964 RepID=UPI0020A3D2AE|nr:AraC family transcriptional regulator [Flavobacterium sp. HSC-32F16]MCP2028797.1 AraC-like DNA-binding protein [Flavobacterium sp. HSC-32F16]
MIYITFLNIAIFQGIVLGFIILKSPLFNSTSNKFLASAIFTLSILLLNLVFEIAEAYHSFPFLRFIDDVEWAFLLPVFVFFFIVNKVNSKIKSKKILYLLFFPFAYSAILNITCDLDIIAGLYKIPDSGLAVIDTLSQIEFFLAFTFIPSLLIYSFSFIKYSEDINEKRWLIILWSIVSTLLFSWVIVVLIAIFFQYDVSFTMKIVALFGTFLIHWTTYVGIFKYKLAKDKAAVYNFLNNDLAISNTNLHIVENNIQEEYKESITADNLYFQKLELLCKEQHIYTDSTLSREKIAEELGISSGYVSQIVNTITGDNFANYINQYRVEAVKEMISNSDYENYNLLTIGLESGFTSKTTFYKAFKKVTGQTPNEYRNSNK